jgi:hypothetical protein
MIDTDIAIIVCSRGREDLLSRLVDDLERGFRPALAAGGLRASTFVYAQGYDPAFLEALSTRHAAAIADGGLVLVTPRGPHARIGDVVRTAVGHVHERARYRLAMLMDDDSVYAPSPAVDENLRRAARRFIAEEHRAYSIKLGTEETLAFGPFVDLDGPIMPFKEKMMWVSRPVLDAALALPRFAELSIGEDAVIAALAWLPAPEACLAVHGLGTFLHLGFEGPPELGGGDLSGGGYAELTGYDPAKGVLEHGKYDEALRTGVTPWHVMPDVFVGPDHPHFIFNGIRADVVARLRAAAQP